MMHTFTDPDLIELDRIWPLGQRLVVSDGGTVVVAGAYRGRYLDYLSHRFPTAQLIGYEPQREICEVARERMKDRHNVTVWNLGLGTGERRFELGRAGTDGATLLRADGGTESVTVINSVEALGAHPKVDLFVVNMEGYEWALIPYLLNEMMHHRIASMAIQFHPEYVSKECAQRVLLQLEEYYDRTYSEYPSWTYWTRK